MFHGTDCQTTSVSRVSDHRVISLHDERFHKHPYNFAGHLRRAEFRDDLIEQGSSRPLTATMRSTWGSSQSESNLNTQRSVEDIPTGIRVKKPPSTKHGSLNEPSSEKGVNFPHSG